MLKVFINLLPVLMLVFQLLLAALPHRHDAGSDTPDIISSPCCAGHSHAQDGNSGGDSCMLCLTAKPSAPLPRPRGLDTFSMDTSVPAALPEIPVSPEHTAMPPAGRHPELFHLCHRTVVILS